MFPVSQFYFYQALCLLANAEKEARKLDEDEEVLLQESQHVIDKWEAHCPENFRYQKQLVEAEIMALSGSQDAAKVYDAAIVAADLSASDYVRAICFERKARYFENTGRLTESRKLYSEAAYFYRQWGAPKIAENLMQPLNSTEIETIATDDQVNTPDFDLNAIVRASQAISSEINMDRLLTRMLEIALEDSYAVYGLLFFVEDEEIYLVAESSEHQTHVFLDTQIPLDQFSAVAKTVVDKVRKRVVDVIVSNAKEDPEFQNDPHIVATQGSSIMCCPITIHGKMVAILYLENSLTTDVFKQERLAYFHTILSQLAISMENARLYADLKAEIEERKSVEQALRASENRMKISQRYANVGNWEFNIRDNTLYWSDGVKDIFGLPHDTPISHLEDFTRRVYPDDMPKIDEALDKCSAGAEHYYVEHRIILPNGDIKWVSEAGDVKVDQHGNPEKMFGLIQDIDSRKKQELSQKKLEQQLQQAQKMESIGQLTGGIAHDFNNILASVLGYSELVKESEQIKASEKLTRYMSEVVSAGNRARDLVAQMLAFSRNDDTVKENTDIPRLVNDSLRMLKSVLPASIAIEFNVAQDKLVANVNPVQIHQVVMNLCINARDAMSGSGELSLNVGKISLDERICTSCLESISGDFIEISVADNGEGIPQTILHRIFDPFFTTKEVGKGTGMGLSMVHGIVHGSGGHLLVESVPGEKTKISILLPLVTSQTKTGSTLSIDELSEQNNSSQLRVLVVDDEASVAKFVVELLDAHQIHADYDTDSAQACEKLLSDNNQFDIVIIDQTMPGMTGLELVSKVRTEKPTTQFILMTGYHEGINEKIVKDAGCAGLLKKPFKTQTLLQEIEKIAQC